MITSRISVLKDFDRLRDFSIRTHKLSDYPVNWQLDRWNFCFSVVMKIKEYSLDEWLSGIKIWEEHGEIISVVNWEGERRGEAFVQVSRLDLPETVLEEMIDFIESKLASGEENNVEVRVSTKLPEFISRLKTRGFKYLEWKETLTVIEIDKEFEVEVAEGYEICDGKDVTGLMKSDAHHMAFGYRRSSKDRQLFAEGFDRMMHMADYREKLDMHMLYDGEVVAFACLWFDKVNKCAVLEPVGTHKRHTKKGLAKALIYEGINRIKALGAERIYVYAELPFYLAIGFEVVAEWPVYGKKV